VMPPDRVPCGPRKTYKPLSEHECLRYDDCCYDDSIKDSKKWCYQKGETSSNLFAWCRRAILCDFENGSGDLGRDSSGVLGAEPQKLDDFTDLDSYRCFHFFARILKFCTFLAARSLDEGKSGRQSVP